jgi:putative DNA primase/helicase
MNEFETFIREHFPEYRIPKDIKPGKFFRFGKKYAGWGLLFEDCSGGVVGDWRNSSKYIWQSAQSKKTPHDREQFAMQIAKAKAIEDAKRELSFMVKAEQCEKLFNEAPEASNDHPYLVKKKVKSHGLKLGQDGSLLVPIYSVMGDMQSLQKIYPGGAKRFYPGAKVAGGCHMIGRISTDHPILICEGYATGASLLEDGNPFVVVAFNAGNLTKVAIDMRDELPQADIIIAGDDDETGREAAIDAARAVGGKYIIPEFGPDRDPKWTDFNDYINSRKGSA